MSAIDIATTILVAALSAINGWLIYMLMTGGLVFKKDIAYKSVARTYETIKLDDIVMSDGVTLRPESDLNRVGLTITKPANDEMARWN